MAKLTKKHFESVFREEILPYVIERYEQDGVPDKPARREAWNNTVDSYIRDRMLPEAAGNWGHPRWLETYRPRGSSHATKKNKKSPTRLDREIAESTGVGTWKKSDQPYMSEHLDIGRASARVKPTSTYSGADYEWTIWIGQPGRRVLHQSGETRTKAGAKRAAERKLATLR